MANVIIPQRWMARRGTAAALTAANEVLFDGEICVETDTGKFKVGDGTTAWTSLKYAGWGLLNAAPTNGQIPVWDNANGVWVPTTTSGGGGAVEHVASTTVSGAAVTAVTFSTLDLSTDKCYMLLFEIKNDLGSSLNVSLYANADTTDTNYYREGYTANNTSLSGSRANNAMVGTLDASSHCVGYLHVQPDVDGRPRAISKTNKANASGIVLQDFTWVRNNTANVTSLSIQVSSANGIAIGSRFRLFRIAS